MNHIRGTVKAFVYYQFGDDEFTIGFNPKFQDTELLVSTGKEYNELFTCTTHGAKVFTISQKGALQV